MSENNQFENILPVAPLKIAALESCREFAQKVDRYLVSFRETANTQHRDNVYFQNYAEESYLVDCSCPRFGTGEAKGRLGESVRGSDLFHHGGYLQLQPDLYRLRPRKPYVTR